MEENEERGLIQISTFISYLTKASSHKTENEQERLGSDFYLSFSSTHKDVLPDGDT